MTILWPSRPSAASRSRRTSFVIKVPECQRSAEVVAEFDGEKGDWEISSVGINIVVRAETFEAGVREWAARWRDFFNKEEG